MKAIGCIVLAVSHLVEREIVHNETYRIKSESRSEHIAIKYSDRQKFADDIVKFSKTKDYRIFLSKEENINYAKGKIVTLAHILIDRKDRSLKRLIGENLYAKYSSTISKKLDLEKFFLQLRDIENDELEMSDSGESETIASKTELAVKEENKIMVTKKLEVRGLTIIDINQYQNYRSEIDVRCEHGHEFTKTIKHLTVSPHPCPTCYSIEKTKANYDRAMVTIAEFCEKYNIKLLNREIYKDINTILEWELPNGEVIKFSYAYMKRKIAKGDFDKQMEGE